MPEISVWFDGDYSECYYGEGHISRRAFAAEVQRHEREECGDENACIKWWHVEHIWCKWLDDERFVECARDNPDAKPFTRYDPSTPYRRSIGARWRRSRTKILRKVWVT